MSNKKTVLDAMEPGISSTRISRKVKTISVENVSYILRGLEAEGLVKKFRVAYGRYTWSRVDFVQITPRDVLTKKWSGDSFVIDNGRGL